MTKSERATPAGRSSGCALRRMAKLVRCVHSHTVCVELERLSFLTQPSVSHLPLTRGLPLCVCKYEGVRKDGKGDQELVVRESKIIVIM